MKTLLCFLCYLLFNSASWAAEPHLVIEGKIITENGTNILCIGTDRPDYDVVRFYLRKTNAAVELRADDILHTDRKVFGPPLPPALNTERDAILTALRARTNVPPDTQLVVSNLLRLQLLDEGQRATNGTRAR